MHLMEHMMYRECASQVVAASLQKYASTVQHIKAAWQAVQTETHAIQMYRTEHIQQTVMSARMSVFLTTHYTKVHAARTRTLAARMNLFKELIKFLR